jgi:hypothetical protein
MAETIGSSETSVQLYCTTRCHIPENSDLYGHRPLKLKLHKFRHYGARCRVIATYQRPLLNKLIFIECLMFQHLSVQKNNSQTASTLDDWISSQLYCVWFAVDYFTTEGLLIYAYVGKQYRPVFGRPSIIIRDTQ